MSIRTFIAIPIPLELANVLGDASAKMAYQDKSNAVRWVDQENYHITLAFLGDQEEHDIEDLAERLDENLDVDNLSISISHFSPFPEGKPKLIAAMIDRNDSLRELHKQVVSSMNASPIEVDKRRFIPHVTLGRYRHSKNPFAGAIISTTKLEVEIEEVTFFESTLTSSGAEYEALFRFPLNDLDYEPYEV